MTRSADDVRNEFLEFFRQRRHTIVPGSPVVPYDDPTLLFTNAGMNQFKDVFLATGTRKFTRAADSQPCIRAGGKHNDLDDVGRDTYHHTFFEMLGNWSFGDYFKKEAIEWAWELLTKVWGLDKTRLHATYFEGDESEGLEPDLEAKELWASVTDIDSANIHPGNKKDNFWEMGDVGPCGPCSEIHIDLTPDKSGAALVNAGDDRAIEIWNLVFIQYNSTIPPEVLDELHKWDVTPQNKRAERFANSYKSRDEILSKHRQLTPLPAKHVDTGMGFERVVAVLQHKNSNYDTDVFAPIFRKIQDITGAPEYGGAPIVSEAPRVSEEEPRASADEPRASARPAPGTREASNRAPSDEPRGLKPAALPGKSDATRQESGFPQPEQDAPHPESNAHQQNMIDVSYRVIADHARCLTFAINDGCVPDREGRGYVLRRILRRAVRYGWQYMNMHEPFLYKLVPAVVDTLGNAFPQLKQKPGQIAEIIREEEESFDRTLDRGIELFEHAIAQAVGNRYLELHVESGLHSFDVVKSGRDYRLLFQPRGIIPVSTALQEMASEDRPVFPGDAAFRLHDTYGFPIDLTQIMAEEKGLKVNIAEYERLMEEARERARAWGKYDDVRVSVPPELVTPSGPTDTSAKFSRDGISARIRAFVQFDLTPQSPAMYLRDQAGVAWNESAGTRGALVLDRTCFYSEAGGQVGDRGEIRHVPSGCVFDVTDTQRVADTILHFGQFRDNVTWRVDDSVELRVHAGRSSTMQNHTATHVMNWALREVLGDHVQQKGSLVDPDKTRFDFSHTKALTPDEIERVEQLCNENIQQNLTVYDKPVPQEQALKIHGLRAIFGEKYPDVVRVLSIGTPVSELLADPGKDEWKNISIEFCGGTHCKNTGEIKHFAIVAEEAVAKGIRRVVGVTGETARRAIERGTELLKQADAAQVAELQQTIADAKLRVVDRAKLRDAITELQKIIKKQQKQQAAVAKDIVADKIDELLKDAPKVGDTTIIVAEMSDLPLDQLKTGADTIKQKCGSAAVLFGVWVNRPSEPEAPARAPSEPDGRKQASQPRAAVPHSESRPGAAVPHSEPEAQARAQGKALLLAAMSNDLIKRGLKSGDLVKAIAPIVQGGGGGPPTMAQAGGKDPDKIPEALAAGRKWIEEKLG